MSMEPTIDNAAKPQQSLEAFRAESMAYATQSVFVNLGANLFEPLINSWWQGRHAKSNNKELNFGRSYLQNLGGEVAGDVGGGGALFLAASLAPQTTRNFVNFTGRLVHPLFYSMGHIAFKDEFNEPDYMAKVNKWSRYQERNFARSLMVIAGNITTNVAAQKCILRNPSPTKVIFQGKLMSTALTNSLMLVARFYAPQKMKDFDNKMGRKYFINGNGEHKKEDAPQQPTNYAQRFSGPTTFPVDFQR